MRWTRGELTVTDDPTGVDLTWLVRELRQTYWASERSAKAIERSLARSTPFVLEERGRQVGFARLVGDGVTYAWLADVLIDPACRGRGLGRFLLECVLAHPDARVPQLRLATKDAHGLYASYGFESCEGMVLRSESST